MADLIMTKGLPASGKSTWATERVLANKQTIRLTKDMLRAMLHAGKWSRDNEKLIVKVRDHMVLYLLGEGYNVIVDDTNLHPDHEARLRELAGLKRARFLVQDFTSVPLDTCLERDAKREHGHVGEKVIRDMWKQFLKPKPAVYTPPAGKPHAIIVDMDGTWALPGDRDPYKDWLCGGDKVNHVVHDIAYSYGTSGGLVIVMSGRDEDRARQPTEEWLERETGNLHHLLLMRKGGDTRKDAIVKRELFDAHVRDHFIVDFVLDDRQQVVDMWRNDIGLVCLQVAEGDF